MTPQLLSQTQTFHPSKPSIPEECIEPPRDDGLPPLQSGAPRRRKRLPHRPAPLQLLQGGPLQGGEHGGRESLFSFSLIHLFPCSLVLLLSLSLLTEGLWFGSVKAFGNLTKPTDFTTFDRGKHGAICRSGGRAPLSRQPCPLLTGAGNARARAIRPARPRRVRARDERGLLRKQAQKWSGPSRTCLRDAFSASTRDAVRRGGERNCFNFDGGMKACCNTNHHNPSNTDSNHDTPERRLKEKSCRNFRQKIDWLRLHMCTTCYA